MRPEQIEGSDKPDQGRSESTLSSRVYDMEEFRGRSAGSSDSRYVGASTPGDLPPLYLAMADGPEPGESPRRLEPAASERGDRFKFSEAEVGDAMRQAAAQGKPIFIKVGTEWCPPCRAMDANAIPQMEGRLQKDAIFLKIDGDRAPELARQLGATSYPTSIVASVRDNGRGGLELVPVHRQSGGMSAQGLSRFLDQGLPLAEKQMQAAGFPRRREGDGGATERRQEPPDDRREEGGERRGGRNDAGERRVSRHRDGSEVEYTRFKDGNERPTAVRFPDGNAVSYKYDGAGRVIETQDFTPDGKPSFHWTCKDGRTWVEDSGKFPVMRGALTIDRDGTHVFRDDKNGNSFVRKPDGSITISDTSGRVIYAKPASR